jgi:hypothetical protein
MSTLQPSTLVIQRVSGAAAITASVLMAKELSTNSVIFRYQAYVVPPAGIDAPGVRVHFSGWEISFDETIPSHELSTRIRPRRMSTLCGPAGLESDTKVRDIYNNRRPSKQLSVDLRIAGSVKSSKIQTPHATGKPAKGRPFQIAQVCVTWHTSALRLGCALGLMIFAGLFPESGRDCISIGQQSQIK